MTIGRGMPRHFIFKIASMPTHKRCEPPHDYAQPANWSGRQSPHEVAPQALWSAGDRNIDVRFEMFEVALHGVVLQVIRPRIAQIIEPAPQPVA